MNAAAVYGGTHTSRVLFRLASARRDASFWRASSPRVLNSRLDSSESPSQARLIISEMSTAFTPWPPGACPVPRAWFQGSCARVSASKVEFMFVVL